MERRDCFASGRLRVGSGRSCCNSSRCCEQFGFQTIGHRVDIERALKSLLLNRFLDTFFDGAHIGAPSIGFTSLVEDHFRIVATGTHHTKETSFYRSLPAHHTHSNRYVTLLHTPHPGFATPLPSEWARGMRQVSRKITDGFEAGSRQARRPTLNNEGKYGPHSTLTLRRRRRRSRGR